jgi:preprotein translocase subunit SecA
MVLGFLSRFVDSNDREIRRLQPLVDASNALEPELRDESDAQIRARMDEIRADLAKLQEGFGPGADELDEDDPARRRDLEAERLKKETEQLPRCSRRPVKPCAGRSGCAISTSR